MLFYKWILGLALIFFITLPVYGETYDAASLRIVINLPSETLDLYAGDKLIKEYPVAIGKPATQTPIGEFHIIDMETNPVWIPPGRGYVVPSGPDNPLGYRWIEFFPAYGIHGTNAPWSIGSAVSNGCVRMKEANVEELFEMVNYKTPVRIIYERTRLSEDESGRVILRLYPDVYGKGLDVSQIYKQLSSFGLQGFVSEESLTEVVKNTEDTQVSIGNIGHIIVNNALSAANTVIYDGITYIPVQDIAQMLKRTVIWDEKQQTVRCAQRSVPGVKEGNRVYVTAENLQMLFGGLLKKTADNYFDYQTMVVSINSKAVTNNVEEIDGILALPVFQIAKAMGQKWQWMEDKQELVIDNKKVPITVIDNQPYIQITKIYEYLHGYVYWNTQNNTIDITYPG